MGQILVTIILVLSFLCKSEGESYYQNVIRKANLKIYFNSTLPYGQLTYLVLTVQKMPDSESIIMHLSTKSYLIMYCYIGKEYQNRPLIFKRTGSVSNELNRVKIQSSGKVSYENGFYAKIKAKFWNIEDETMTLVGQAPLGGSAQNIQNLKIKVDQSNSETRLSFQRCSDPNAPLRITVARGLLMHLDMLKSNSSKIKPKFRWQLMDLVGETQYFKTTTDKNMIFLKRYTIRFHNVNNLWENHLMLLVEAVYEGNYIAGARCYLYVQMRNIQAIIGGGDDRLASYSSPLVMDGTMSRDYSKNKDGNQLLRYFWSCQAFSGCWNSICVQDISKSNLFTIPAYSLTVNCNYKFTLLVRDDDNPKRYSRTTQIVTMVSSSVVQVMIICVFNCVMDMYSPLSKVLLSARCSDCGASTLTYQWYVSDQLTLSKVNLTMYIRTVMDMAKVQLVINTSDGRSGTQIKYLKKNLGARDGKCTVEPSNGTEVLTKFYPCCKDFKTKYLPLEYWYYAGRVLLRSCYDCSCGVHLPVVTEIKVLICDNFLVCSSSMIPVHVEPLKNIPDESPGAILDYLKNAPHNVPTLVNDNSDIHYLQILQSTASHISQVASAIDLISLLIGSGTCNRPSLGKLANLTLTLASRLKPISAECHGMLTTLLTLLNNNFACIFSLDMEYLLVEQPFINITQSCVTVYDLMKRLSAQAPRPPKSIYKEYNNAVDKGKLNNAVIIRLIRKINKFTDEDAKRRSTTWVNSMWQTERLYRFLGYARDYGLQPDNNGDINTEAVALEIQCFFFISGKTYYIETSDSMHKVEFKFELLKELNYHDDNWICLKVVSTIRHLNWWYPEERQPSSVLLSVRIYHSEDHFKKEVPLKKSTVKFITSVGKYKPAEAARTVHKNLRSENDILDDDIDPEEQISEGQYINTLEVGELKYMQDVLMYRIVLEELTMLAVRFTSSTHKLHVKLTMVDPPLFSEVSASPCSVPANITSKTLLIRNNCKEVKRAYMAVRVWGKKPPRRGTRTPVPMGPAAFAFIFQMRSCDHWVYSKERNDQHWGHFGCKPSMTVNVSLGIRCSCHVVSTYTSYVYTVPAIVVLVDPITNVQRNNFIILFYFILIFGLSLWLLWLFLYNSKQPSKTVVCDMSGIEGVSRRDVHDILVELKTGGRINALTTASVKLSFFTTQGKEVRFTLMQDPERPVLQRNSSYILWLRSRDIRIPTKIAVSHNSNGRYPDWFIQRIEVSDVQRQETQVFLVHRWVKDQILILTSSLIFKRGDARFVGSWCRRFRLYCEKEFTNWFLFQPIIGTWRDFNEYPSMSRFKRSCVFFSKLVIVYSIVACYLGPTTVESLQRDRTKFVSFDDWLFLSVFCSLVSIFVQMFFNWLVNYYS